MLTSNFKYCFITCLLLITGFRVQSQSSPYFITTFDEEATGADQVNVWLTQDPQGKVVCANLQGLLSFDGQAWKLQKYQHKGVDLELHHVAYIDGKIFVGCNNEIGVLKPKGQSYIYQSFKTGEYANAKINNAIIQIIRYQGSIFFMSLDKLIIVKQGKIVQVVKATKGTGFTHLSIIDQNLYLAQFGKGLLLWQNNQLVFQNTQPRYKRDILLFRQKAFEGTLTCFSRSGIWLNNQKVAFPETVNKALKEGIIQFKIFDKKRLIFGTLRGNVYLLNLRTKNIEKVFAGKTLIKALHLDPYQNLWVIDNDYIHHIILSSPFTNLTPQKSIFNITANQQGIFGSVKEQNVLFWKKSSGDTSWISLPHTIQSMIAIETNQLLVGTRGGIYLLNLLNKEYKLIDPRRDIRFMRQDPLDKNIMYVASSNTLFFYRLINGQLELLKRIDDLDLGISNIVRTDRHLWLSHETPGITCLTLNPTNPTQILSKKLYSTKRGDFVGDDAENHVQQWQGKIWMHNAEGVYWYDAVKDRFKAIKIQGIGSDKKFYSTLIAFQQNQFLVTGKSTASTLGMVTQSKPDQFQLNSTPFASLPNLKIEKLFHHQGKFYLATSKGLFCYDPTKVKNYQATFQTILSKAEHQGKSIPSKVVLEYGQNTVRFEFASNYFEVPEKTQFAYQLEGMGQSWSAWSIENKKEFNNLREGHYRFRVKARNVYGVEGKPVTFSFEILPPWYRTWWAYALYTLLALLGIYGLFNVYTYRIRLRNRQLEQQVQVRTQELNEANEELTTANEQLKELGDLKESFSQMLIHDARQPLTPIITSSDPLIKDSGLRLKTFFDNFLEVQKFESAEVQLHAQPILLGALVGEVLTQLRFSATQKMITITNHLPSELVVQIDEAYILRVFTNLIGNAIKYIPASGNIRLESEPPAEEGFVKIWVKDDGIGVPDELKNTIFDKFTRANKADKRSTGLGLTFCKMVVEAHGGHIGLLTQTEQQQKGVQGGAFWLTLPYQKEGLTTMAKQAQEVVNVQYQFTPEDKVLVKTILPQLKQLEFCDSSDIAAVFDDRNWQGSEALEAWIDALPFMQNQQDYLRKLEDIS
ncbi:hypothetical protein BKI52_27915 [marine bacterium AO1-C]|nr:hypothetical protein BKI52_27915 [marine bacterium AO1-C]